jgi:hypothetical protein
MTVAQSIAMYDSIAKEIIENGWSKHWSSKESIISDLEDISLHESGYEIAKELENSDNAAYNFTTEFIEYLDGVGFKEIEIIDNNVRAWVNAHNITPLFSVGDKFTLNKTIASSLVKDSTWTVFRIDQDVAQYVLIKEDTPSAKYFAKYEDVERNI